MTEASAQLLIRLPDSLARRFKRHVATRQRSKFIARLLEEALPPEEDIGRRSRCIKPRLRSSETSAWHRKWPSGKKPPSLMASLMAAAAINPTP